MQFQLAPVYAWDVTFIYALVIILSNFDISLLLIYFVLISFCITSSLIHWQNTSNFIITFTIRFVSNIIAQNLRLFRNPYFSLMYCLFWFIIIANCEGLFPYAWTSTNSFVNTFYLAFTHFFIINFWAILERAWNFCNQFFNIAIPFVISPLLVPVEFISYVSRILSLSIRLFANISSGHSLLKILIGFSWVLALHCVVGISLTEIIGALAALNAPWSLVSSVMVLENLIAGLQSYVFVILLVIYISDVVLRH